ncbi:hypothetical protein RCS94_06965 [Orbaceae bacterium ac157xtp]
MAKGQDQINDNSASLNFDWSEEQYDDYDASLAIKQQAERLETIQLPIDIGVIFEPALFNSLSENYKDFFELPLDELNIEIGKLPQVLGNIQPIIVESYVEKGDVEVFLYLFSPNYNILDKLLIYNNEYTFSDVTSSIGHYNARHFFYIDKEFNITIKRLYPDESLEIRQYKISPKGKFEEQQITNSCHLDTQLKDKNINSEKSLLLTPYSNKNHLKPYDWGYLRDVLETTLTLNVDEKQLCINYLDAHQATFGKANAKEFLADDELYAQLVDKLKKYNIDISQHIEYVQFDNIQNSVLTKYLINGNKAIYMNNILFIVGGDYFAVYRQPKK